VFPAESHNYENSLSSPNISLWVTGFDSGINLVRYTTAARMESKRKPIETTPSVPKVNIN
jgi:hypothetical protein